jgi:hypothetical protein
LSLAHDALGILTYINPATALTLDYEANELAGVNLRALIARPALALYDDYIGRAAEDPSYSVIVPLLARNGGKQEWACLSWQRNPVPEKPYAVGYLRGHPSLQLKCCQRVIQNRSCVPAGGL